MAIDLTQVLPDSGTPDVFVMPPEPDTESYGQIVEGVTSLIKSYGEARDARTLGEFELDLMGVPEADELAIANKKLDLLRQQREAKDEDTRMAVQKELNRLELGSYEGIVTPYQANVMRDAVIRKWSQKAPHLTSEFRKMASQSYRGGDQRAAAKPTAVELAVAGAREREQEFQKSGLSYEDFYAAEQAEARAKAMENRIKEATMAAAIVINGADADSTAYILTGKKTPSTPEEQRAYDAARAVKSNYDNLQNELWFSAATQISTYLLNGRAPGGISFGGSIGSGDFREQDAVSYINQMRRQTLQRWTDRMNASADELRKGGAAPALMLTSEAFNQGTARINAEFDRLVSEARDGNGLALMLQRQQINQLAREGKRFDVIERYFGPRIRELYQVDPGLAKQVLEQLGQLTEAAGDPAQESKRLAALRGAAAGGNPAAIVAAKMLGDPDTILDRGLKFAEEVRDGTPYVPGNSGLPRDVEAVVDLRVADQMIRSNDPRIVAKSLDIMTEVITPEKWGSFADTRLMTDPFYRARLLDPRNANTELGKIVTDKIRKNLEPQVSNALGITPDLKKSPAHNRLFDVDESNAPVFTPIMVVGTVVQMDNRPNPTVSITNDAVRSAKTNDAIRSANALYEVFYARDPMAAMKYKDKVVGDLQKVAKGDIEGLLPNTTVVSPDEAAKLLEEMK